MTKDNNTEFQMILKGQAVALDNVTTEPDVVTSEDKKTEPKQSPNSKGKNPDKGIFGDPKEPIEEVYDLNALYEAGEVVTISTEGTYAVRWDEGTKVSIPDISGPPRDRRNDAYSLRVNGVDVVKWKNEQPRGQRDIWDELPKTKIYGAPEGKELIPISASATADDPLHPKQKLEYGNIPFQLPQPKDSYYYEVEKPESSRDSYEYRVERRENFLKMDHNIRHFHPDNEGWDIKNNEFLWNMARRESDLDPYIRNGLGYSGLFQFGTAALRDTSIMTKNSRRFITNYSGEEIADKPVVNWSSYHDNWQAQMVGMVDYLSMNMENRNIKDHPNFGTEITRYSRGEVETYTPTEAGIAAVSHLLGARRGKAMLEGRSNPTDGFGTKDMEYFNKFKDFELDLSFRSEEKVRIEAAEPPKEIQQHIRNYWEMQETIRRGPLELKSAGMQEMELPEIKADILIRPVEIEDVTEPKQSLLQRIFNKNNEDRER